MWCARKVRRLTLISSATIAFLILLFGEDLAYLKRSLLGIEDHVALAVEHSLEILESDVQDGATLEPQ